MNKLGIVLAVVAATLMTASPVRAQVSTGADAGERTAALEVGGTFRPASSAQSATGSGGAPDRRHTFGFGGRAGGFTFGVGASARYWGSEKLALQLDLSHYGVSTLGITQVAPSVLFVLGTPDLSKPTQIRPYGGGGINIMRISEDYSDFGFSELNDSETSIGGQGMVGAEMVFAGAPNFALSGDLGYYSTGKFFGVSIGGFALSVSGHYYFK